MVDVNRMSIRAVRCLFFVRRVHGRHPQSAASRKKAATALCRAAVSCLARDRTPATREPGPSTPAPLCPSRFAQLLPAVEFCACGENLNVYEKAGCNLSRHTPPPWHTPRWSPPTAENDSSLLANGRYPQKLKCFPRRRETDADARDRQVDASMPPRKACCDLLSTRAR